MSETESKPQGPPLVAKTTGGKTSLFVWPQAGYDELVEQTELLQSLNSKMTFFTIILIIVIVVLVLNFISR